MKPWQPSDAEGAPVDMGGGWQPTYVDKAAVTAPAPAGGAGGGKPAGYDIVVVDPEGKHFKVDASYLAQLQGQGYHVATAQDIAVKQYLKQNEGFAGALEVGGRQFLDTVSFGAYGALREHEEKTGIDALTGENLGVDPFALAKWHALKNEHATASAVGIGGGLVAQTVLGGPLFKAAAKAGGIAEAAVLGTKATGAAEAVSQGALKAEYAYRLAEAGATAAEVAGTKAAPGFLRTVAAGAARMGVEGGVLAAPAAMTHAILGDPDRAAEVLLFGGVVGGALGGGIAGLGYLGKRIGGGIAARLAGKEGGELAAAEADKALVHGVDTPSGGKTWLQKQANEQAFRAISPNEAALSKVLKAFDKSERNIPDKVGEFLHEQGLAHRVGESAEDYAARVGGFLDETSGSIHNFWRQPALEGKTFDTGKALSKIEGMLADFRKNPATVELADQLESKWVRSFREIAAENGGAVDFATAHSWRVGLDKLAYREAKAMSPIVEELRHVRGVFNGEMEAQAAQAAKSVSPGFAADLAAINRKYRFGAAVMAGAEDGAFRAAKNNMLSLRDSGYGAAFGAAFGALSGGPAGMLAAAGAAVGHKILREEGNAAAAAVLQGIATGRGLRVLESSFAGHYDKLQRIPAALRAMGEGKRLPALTEAQGVSVVTRLLSPDGDPSPQIKRPADAMKFADGLATLANRPEEMARRIEDMTSAISKDAPDVAQSATLKAGQVASYILAARPVSPEIMSPFAREVWKPSDQQMRDFHAKVKTALDPYEAIRALEDKTLSAAHMDALQATAPKMYAEFVRRVADFAATPEAAPIPYAYRLKLSMLTGAPLDRTVANLAGFQAVFQQPDMAAAAEGKAPKIADGTGTSIDKVSG